jgi:hypothetical protein
VRASPDKRVVRGSTPRACTKNADRRGLMRISGSICESEVKYADPMQTGAARRRSRSSDRTRRVKPEWRGSGLLTRPQVARNHPGPPFRTSDPSGKGPGLLTRRESYVGSSPTWSSNIRARGKIGRRTISRGWRATMSVRLRPSAPLPRLVEYNGPATQLVKRIRCLRIFEGFDPSAGRHASTECSAAWERISFGTRGAQVQILPLRPISCP